MSKLIAFDQEARDALRRGVSKLAQAVRVTSALVDTLRDDDQLELVEFSDSPRRWKRGPVAATASARREALAWLSSLRASGSTEMRSGILAALADQDAGQRGLFVDYFGKPASTHKAVALLALEHRVPLAVTGTYKVRQPMGYEIATEEVIFPEDYDGKPDAIRAITQRFTSALERLVRLAPEQYFWLHRRWKHQPQARKGKRTAASRAA